MLLREQAQTFFLFNDKPPARFGIAVTDDKGEWRHAEINMVQNATIDKNVPSPRTLFEDRLTADKAAEPRGCAMRLADMLRAERLRRGLTAWEAGCGVGMLL